MDVLSVSVHNFHENPLSSLQFVQDNWEQIRYFRNGEKVREGQLCKYRGMVQDMPNPVYYYSKYQVLDKSTGRAVLKSGKYFDSLPCEENETLNLDCGDCETGERRPYLLVPVPGVSEWAQHTPHSPVLSDEPITETSSKEDASTRDPKRTSDDMEVDDESCKRLCTDRVGGESSIPDTEAKPLTEPSSLGCLVMMYDIADGTIKLNEVVDVVGFLYGEALSPTEADEFDDSYKPVSPLIPRLHAVAFRKITNFNPLVKSLDTKISEEFCREAGSLRSDLHLALSQMFFGDSLVADYLICHLISRISYRSDSDLIIGKFSLNISRLPEKYLSKEAYNVLRQLLPKVIFLPFNIESLNKTRLLPKKNYSTGNLDSGLLQLSENTHLVIDETQLKEGRLQDTGVKNVNALQALIKQQKIDYDFTYYSLGFNTDIPVLILSTTKSILPSDMEVRLVPDASSSSKLDESFEAVNKFLNEDLLKRLRTYLTIASNLEFHIPDEYQQMIQDEFVTLRQQDPTITGDDLHDILVLCRFMALSFCQTSLTRDIWNKAKEMTLQRKSRLRLY